MGMDREELSDKIVPSLGFDKMEKEYLIMEQESLRLFLLLA